MQNNRIDTIKIIQHNVIAWTYERRAAYINFYLKQDPEIILLNSTGILENENIKIQNYNIYQKNNKNERSAGVAIAIRKNIKHRIIDNFDSDILMIQLNTSKGLINIATIYQPPRRQYLINTDMAKIMHSNIPTYLIGDMNARHPFIGHVAANHIGRNLHQFITAEKLIHVGPDFNTMVSKMNSRTICRPDIVLTNQRAHLNIVIKAGPITPSDHLPLDIIISTKPVIKELVDSKNIKKANWEDFQEKMNECINKQVEEIKLENINNITKDTIDEASNRWLEDIKENIENCSPTKRYKLNKHIPDSDYMKLLIQYLKYYQDNIQIWNRDTIEIIRNIQNQIIEEANRQRKENWEGKLVKLNRRYKENQTQFWEEYARLTGKSIINIPYLLNENGEKVEDKLEHMTLLTETWKNTFRITEDDNQNFDEVNERRVEEELNRNRERITPYANPDLSRLNEEEPMISPIKIVDILNTVKRFKNKAPGTSGINKIILSKLPATAWKRLEQILNLTISMGYYPIPFKKGILILPPKPGKDPKIPINRRPITLLEVPGKILESIINSRLREYLENNNKYYKHQHGFRRGRGTETALLTIYETIAMNQRNKQQQCNLVCRDISKAFDKVWHSGLKYKILQLGIPELAEKLLSNYLDNRTVQIRDQENNLGDNIEIKSGVPQGGILSPTMFTIYTSDMPETPEYVLNIAYADDVTQVILEQNRSKNLLARKTIREIERLNNYENLWKIKTNKNKFQILSISKTKPAKIYINNVEIPFTDEIKVLGLTMKFNGITKHLTNRMLEARKRRSALRRFYKLDENIKSHLFKSMIRPVFEYPITPTCIMKNTSKRKIQQFQNVSLRQIYKSRGNDRDNHGNDNNRQTNEALHTRYKIEPINIRLHKLAKKSLERFKNIYPEVATRSENIQEYEEDLQLEDHYWWRRVSAFTMNDEPEPEFD